ncbi:MAG TPA: hypothetical protein VFJ02_08155 [Vicinamibacterales bacterium]|nr:hypothetical protein [Vicinamibacterales bacterium]
MTRRALILIAGLALVPAIRFAPIAPAAEPLVSRLPRELSGPDFWKLSAELSEPDGYFRSDNLVSNEVFMQRVIPELAKMVKPGRVYLGVGPEQNFTYIAAVKPAMAFIIDIRRGNLQLHLMYKALFELSADRAEFVSRLFSLRRPAALGRKSTVDEIFTAYNDPALRSDDLYKQNLAAIRDLFQKKRMPLSTDDLSGIERVYEEFFTRGPSIHYEVTPGSAGSFPTYVEVMIATDDASVQRSFLSSEERFETLKDLQARNLVVPVVGNFAGPKAIRAIGSYAKRHGALVGAFYVSNVEQYLMREGGIDRFCASAATLPLDEGSTFIRSERGGFAPRAQRGPGGFGAGFTSQLHNIREDVRSCGR